MDYSTQPRPFFSVYVPKYDWLYRDANEKTESTDYTDFYDFCEWVDG